MGPVRHWHKPPLTKLQLEQIITKLDAGNEEHVDPVLLAEYFRQQPAISHLTPQVLILTGNTDQFIPSEQVVHQTTAAQNIKIDRVETVEDVYSKTAEAAVTGCPSISTITVFYSHGWESAASTARRERIDGDVLQKLYGQDHINNTLFVFLSCWGGVNVDTMYPAPTLAFRAKSNSMMIFVLSLKLIQFQAYIQEDMSRLVALHERFFPVFEMEKPDLQREQTTGQCRKVRGIVLGTAFMTYLLEFGGKMIEPHSPITGRVMTYSRFTLSAEVKPLSCDNAEMQDHFVFMSPCLDLKGKVIWGCLKLTVRGQEDDDDCLGKWVRFGR